MARHPAPDPPEVEGPAPPRVVTVQKEGLDPPAGERRRRHRIQPAEAADEAGPAAGLGGQLQPPSGQEIEPLQLDHDTSHGRRAQSLVRRPQDRLGLRRLDHEQPLGRDAEAGEPRPVESARPPQQTPIGAPDEIAPPGQEKAPGQGRGEPVGKIAPNLVQGRERQPAPGQMRVDRPLPEPRHRHAEPRPAAFETADPGTQGSKGRGIGQGDTAPGDQG